MRRSRIEVLGPQHALELGLGHPQALGQLGDAALEQLDLALVLALVDGDLRHQLALHLAQRLGDDLLLDLHEQVAVTFLEAEELADLVAEESPGDRGRAVVGKRGRRRDGAGGAAGAACPAGLARLALLLEELVERRCARSGRLRRRWLPRARPRPPRAWSRTRARRGAGCARRRSTRSPAPCARRRRNRAAHALQYPTRQLAGALGRRVRHEHQQAVVDQATEEVARPRDVLQEAGQAVEDLLLDLEAVQVLELPQAVDRDQQEDHRIAVALGALELDPHQALDLLRAEQALIRAAEGGGSLSHGRGAVRAARSRRRPCPGEGAGHALARILWIAAWFRSGSGNEPPGGIGGASKRP